MGKNQRKWALFVQNMAKFDPKMHIWGITGGFLGFFVRFGHSLRKYGENVAKLDVNLTKNTQNSNNFTQNYQNHTQITHKSHF